MTQKTGKQLLPLPPPLPPYLVVLEQRLPYQQDQHLQGDCDVVKRLAKELLYLAFTLAGIGLVLITLTDQVLRWAIYISVISLVMHLAGVAIDYRQDNNNDTTSST